MARDRVVDLVRRRVRLVDADGQRSVGLKSGNEEIGDAPIFVENDADLPWARLAEKDRREGMNCDQRCG